MKVVINSCFGGFSLSPEATLRLYELGYTEGATPVSEYFSGDRDQDGMFGKNTELKKWRNYLSGTELVSMFLTVFSPDEQFVLSTRDISRDHPLLLQVLDEMGELASGRCASLRVVEIPDGVQYEIQEYDGNEHIAEAHRTWS